ncbi:MAG: hypothetical protein GY795_39660 [Desulfobacterales bacterium]|nr:hypothetical protein [Desulfobacterales bacterium]
MNKRVFKTVIVIMMILSFLSSCATMQGIVNKPQNSAEREIFIQAIATAAAIGAVAGGIYGYTKDGKDKSEEDKKKSAAKAAGWGALAGSIIGTVVANEQIKNLRDFEMKNDQLEVLLKNAREYNQRVANDNNDLRQQIAQLRNNTKTEQARIAMDKKKQLEKYQAQVQAAIAERTELSEKLVPKQKEQYQKTLRGLEAEKQKLIAAIEELNEIYEHATIGE